MAKTTIHVLEVLPGQEPGPAPTAAPKDWFKRVDCYVEIGRGSPVYWSVRAGAKHPARVTLQEAVTCKQALNPADAVAHDILMERAPAEPVEPEAPAPGVAFYPTALDCMKAYTTDFRVVARPIRRGAEPLVIESTGSSVDPNPDWPLTPIIPGYRSIDREDTGVTLHVATDAYEPAQSETVLSMPDAAVARGEAAYTYSWQSVTQARIRPTHEGGAKTMTIQGRQVGILFTLPSVRSGNRFGGKVWAGGTLVTSHDGSMAATRTACLVFNGTPLFHPVTGTWRHTLAVNGMIEEQGRASMDFLVRSARGLVRDAEATIDVGPVVAADLILRAIRPELYEEISGAITAEDAAELAEAREKMIVRATERLDHEAARITDSCGVALGGFAYVLASPYAFSNRVSRQSLYDGTARERMTLALLTLARHAGLAEAGMVPENNDTAEVVS